MTRAISTRLKLSVDPLVYSYDSPGVMLPFLGKGDQGAERGIKLALIGEYSTERWRSALRPHCLVDEYTCFVDILIT